MKKIDIEDLFSDRLQLTRPVVEIYKFKPYHFCPTLTNEQLSNFVLEDLDCHLRKSEQNHVFLVKDGHIATGLATFRLLPWDTQIFNTEMAAIDYLMSIGEPLSKYETLNRLLLELKSLSANKKISHLSIRANASDLPVINALERNRFNLMDILVTYCFDFTKPYSQQAKYPWKIREQGANDIEPVIAIARDAFHNYIDRFHSDPNLSGQNSDRLYAEWARNACLREAADYVAVADINGEVIGFTTFKIHKNINKLGHIKIYEADLVAVSPRAQGKGVSTSLIRYGLNWALDQSSDAAITRFIYKTQVVNTISQRVLANIGFRMVDSQVTFHRWFKEDR